MPPELKSSNPKDSLGADKVPMHLWPVAATTLGSLGLMEGALKYGRNNWRVHGVLASTYMAAAMRHMNDWFQGIERSTDTGNMHLGNALACLAIIVDAQAHGKLIDDRNYCPPELAMAFEEFMAAMTREVPRLRVSVTVPTQPHHYTRQDNHGTQAGNYLHPVCAPPLPEAPGIYKHQDQQSLGFGDGGSLVQRPEG